VEAGVGAAGSLPVGERCGGHFGIIKPMANRMNQNIRFYTLPQTWYGRLLAAVVGVVLLLLAIFFFTFFIIVFALSAIIMTIYVFLFGKKYEKTASGNMIQVEYIFDDAPEESEALDGQKDKSPGDKG
jgi:uncharacterized membrane protein YdbT with pleckstrin-like domain